MPFKPQHSIPRGLHRLLKAPQDVEVENPVPWREPPLKLAAAAAGHRALFAEYVSVLDEAIELAEEWWDGMVQKAVDRGLAPDAALDEVRSRIFAGPAARGELVWTLRTFWLRCDGLNREVEAAQRVPPQVLLLRWLADEGRDHWIEILTGMPYWPIGVDEKGRWV